MKYVDEFRDPQKARRLIEETNTLLEQIDLDRLYSSWNSVEGIRTLFLDTA